MLDEKVWIRYQALRAPRNEGLGSLAESEVIVHSFDKVTQYLLLKSFVWGLRKYFCLHNTTFLVIFYRLALIVQKQFL